MKNPIYDFWFKEDCDEIFIVTMRESAPKKDAYTISNDYAYCDNCGDLDLLFYSYGLLNRYYPRTKINFFYAEDFKQKIRDWEKKNILILGGPNSRNDVCRFFMYGCLPKIYKNLEQMGHPSKAQIFFPPKKKCDLKPTESKRYSKEHVCGNCAKLTDDCPRTALCKRYSDGSSTFLTPIFDDELMCTLNSEREKTLYEDRILGVVDMNKVLMANCLSQDVGLFACFSNINDENCENRIVMISGTHTFGGVGVFKAVNAQSNQSMKNYNSIGFSMLKHIERDFICCMNVEITEDRNISVPKISFDNIIPLSLSCEFLNCNKENMPYNTFISYRRGSGAEYSQKVFGDFLSDCENIIIPFRDIVDKQSNFLPGADYVVDIQRKIKNSAVFIMIVTPDCLKYETHFSGSFFDEFVFALRNNKTIIPIQFNNGDYDLEIKSAKDDIVKIAGWEYYNKATRINAISYISDELVGFVKNKLKGLYCD